MKIDYIVSSAENINFSDDSFDVITAPKVLFSEGNDKSVQSDSMPDQYQDNQSTEKES